MTRDLVLTALSLGVWGIGEGLFIYFQPLYLQKLGANPVTIGVILGAAGIGMAAAHIPAGYLADKFGPRPLLWASWITATLAAWLMAVSTSLGLFTAGLLIYSLTAFVIAPLNSYVTAARGRLSAGRALTLVQAGYNLGAVVGPALGGAIGELYGLRSLYTIGASITVVSTLMIFFISRQPAHSEAGTRSHLELARNPAFTALLAWVFMAMFAIYLPQPLTPNFLQNQRLLPLGAIGRLVSIGNLGSVVLMLSLGQLNSFLALFAGQIAMVLFTVLIWRGTGLPWFSLGYFFIGGYRLCRSMVSALARPMVHPAQIGLAFGLVETTNAITLVLAPILAGLLYQQNPASIYPVSLGLIAVSFLGSLIFMGRQQSLAKAKLTIPQQKTD